MITGKADRDIEIFEKVLNGEISSADILKHYEGKPLLPSLDRMIEEARKPRKTLSWKRKGGRK